MTDATKDLPADAVIVQSQKSYVFTVDDKKAKRVPGIVRYVINLAPDLAGTDPELPYDGIAEVWFRSEADLRASARSPEVALVLEDEKNLFDLATRFTLVVSEHVMVAEPRL